MVRRLLGPVIASVLAAVCLAGCSSAPPVTYMRYQYACCAASDVQHAWHPGETLTMHWSAQSTLTTDSTTQILTLTAALSGPYADVNSLKQGGAASTSLTAAPLHASNATPSNPISVIALPANLAPGFYNLTGVVAAPGGSQSGSSVIQVAKPGT